MYLREHFLELILQQLVLGALVKLAQEVTAGPQGIARKLECGLAQVLQQVEGGMSDRYARYEGTSCDALQPTMLPAWSLKAIPLVFIILI